MIMVILGCAQNNKLPYIGEISSPIFKKNILTETERRVWHHKDILEDSLPGISLKKAYKEILREEKGKNIIVAVLDTEIDIYHEDLRDHIWKNTDEIPNNGLDDDQNGYIDDVNGWNFLGNDRGENIIYANLECTRIIKKYKNQFEGKTIDDFEGAQQTLFREYNEAKAHYDSQLKSALSAQKYGNFLVDTYPKSKALLKAIYPDEDYTVEALDSMYNFYKDKDKEKSKLIYYMADYIKYKLTQKWINDYKAKADAKINTTYNESYVDREILGDDPEDLNSKQYGNNRVSGNLDIFYHGTLVAGLIAANRNNDIGIDGITEHVKIMPVCISAEGNEHDKDIALGIRYAVDNGAKVINMSFGKDFSLHKEWVLEAIRYAAENEVLIVSSSGNSSYNLEEYNNYYPIDNIDNGEEVSDNFLLVGSISRHVDKNLLSYYSNYSNIDVDVFAPGENMYTTLPKNEYKYDSGTSLASAITSGVAALIRSYYPKLSASEVKHIIMASGVAYDIEVEVTQEDGTKTMLPFSELSKSGKVVNAYNALLMAEEVSKE